METKLPRIEAVDTEDATTVRVGWSDGTADMIDLAGWIATGGPMLDPLTDADLFKQVRVGDHGASLEWDDDGDLAIDAHHLRLLARAQSPFTSTDVAAWQEAMNLSNREAADFFQTALSTWNSYKAGAPIPVRIAMICRAAERDPLLMQAYYRPRKAGRPKKKAAA